MPLISPLFAFLLFVLIVLQKGIESLRAVLAAALFLDQVS